MAFVEVNWDLFEREAERAARLSVDPYFSPYGFFVVFDIDGPMVDSARYKRHVVDTIPPDWDAYFAACPDDKPVEPLALLFRFLAAPCDKSAPLTRVDIWSGRSEEVRAETVDWLRRFRLRPSRLLMRPRNDARTHAELKGEWLAVEKSKPDLVIVDTLEAVHWWRQQGVFVLSAGHAVP